MTSKSVATFKMWYNENMANNIVQLVDNDENNIFPVAGSMASDSIETNMLKDSCVTSQKIDWTTLETTYSTATKESYVTLVLVDVHIKTDTNNKFATIWGRTETTSSQAAESTLTIQTTLRPSSNIEIIPSGFVYGVDNNGKSNGNFSVAFLRLSTAGVLSIRNINWSDNTSGNKCRTWMFPITITL